MTIKNLVDEFLSLIPFNENMTVISFLYSLLSVFVGLIFVLILFKMLFTLIKSLIDFRNWKV